MKIKNLNLINKANFILISIITLSFFSGLFSYGSAILNIDILKLWKEFLLIAFIVVNLMIVTLRKDKRAFTMFYIVPSIFFLFYVFYSFFFKGLPFIIIIYQLKLDMILVFFITSLLNLLNQLEKEKRAGLYKRLVSLVIIFGVLNALIIILQYNFFNQFLNLINLEYGNWGTSKGIKVITAGGEFRAIGLQNGFVQSGTLVFIAFILLAETKKVLTKKLWFKTAALSILAIGIFFTTYKTAILGLLLYGILKAIDHFIRSDRYKNILTIFTVFFVPLFMFLSTHFRLIYEFFHKIHPYFAERSILPRVEQHWSILSELFNGFSFIFGMGLGKNGTFGLEKNNYGVNSSATDSTYIYLMSNYGLICTIIFIFAISILLIYLTGYPKKSNAMFHLLVYSFSIEFFYNNGVVNFPANYIILTILLFGLLDLIINVQKDKVYINGRFLTQSVTGVQRFAIETLLELDKVSSSKSYILLVPDNKEIQIKLKNIVIKKTPYLKGHIWEQFILPIISIKALLLNLCNTGPILKKKQIVVIHDVSVYGFPSSYNKKFIMWYKFIYFFLKNSTKILTVSEFSKSEILRYLRVSEEKVSVVPEGREHIDRIKHDDSILTRNKLTEGNYILAVSSNNPNKNFQSIVSALNYLEKDEIKVVIAGGDNDKVFGNNMDDITNEVIKVGYVSDEELKSLYVHAGCFVYPSFYEGFGIPPLEAMSCGCPSIVSHTASMPEVCGDSVLYCNPYSPEDIAEKINQIISDDELRTNLVKLGKKQSQKYKWKNTAEELEKYIEVFR
jgi:glycosyltransferase involved in cell wall biosynthesis